MRLNEDDMNFIKKYIWNKWEDFVISDEHVIKFIDHFPIYRYLENKIIQFLYVVRQWFIKRSFIGFNRSRKCEICGKKYYTTIKGYLGICKNHYKIYNQFYNQ